MSIAHIAHYHAHTPECDKRLNHTHPCFDPACDPSTYDKAKT